MDIQTMQGQADLLDENFLQDIKARLLARGASDAAVDVVRSRSLGVTVRNGEFEDVSHDEGCSLGLRAFVGNRSANVSTNDCSPDVIETLIDRVVRMAHLASEDPFGQMPDAILLAPAGSDVTLDIFDPEEPTLADMEQSALDLERHAFAVEGVVESEGASTKWGFKETRVVASNGLSRHSRRTASKTSVRVFAGSGDDREVDGFGHSARWRADLLSLAEIGRRAGECTVEKLGSRKIESCRAPVIFDRLVAMSLMNALLGAISGGSIHHKQTFLPDALGQQIFPKGFALVEAPFRQRGLSSRMTDGDGMAPFDGAIVDDGVVQTLLIGHYDSKRLGIASTGHSGGTSNLTVLPGVLGREAMLREAGRGLIVKGMMGYSGNPHTGDFSMGVSGLWFEGGEIAYPVSEVTIAGNFKDIFANLIAGADIEYLGADNSPSLLAPPLAIGGK